MQVHTQTQNIKKLKILKSNTKIQEKSMPFGLLYLIYLVPDSGPHVFVTIANNIFPDGARWAKTPGPNF